MTLFAALFRREWRRSGVGWTVLAFALAVATIFTFAIGPDLPLLRGLAPAIVWCATLLAVLLSCLDLFREDLADGTVDWLRSERASFSTWIAAVAVARWLGQAAPLVPAAFVAGLALGQSAGEAARLAATILVGTPGLVSLGTIAAALTARSARRGVLLPLLAMPFFVPAVVFGVGATAPAGSADLALLAAFSIVATIAAPFVGGAALRSEVR